MPLSSLATQGPGHRDESCGCVSVKHNLLLKLVRLVYRAPNYQPSPSHTHTAFIQSYADGCQKIPALRTRLWQGSRTCEDLNWPHTSIPQPGVLHTLIDTKCCCQGEQDAFIYKLHPSMVLFHLGVSVSESVWKLVSQRAQPMCE